MFFFLFERNKTYHWKKTKCNIENQTSLVLDLQMQSVEGGGQFVRHHLQVVARHGEDLQAVRAVEHLFRKPDVSQLVVVEIHRPASRGKERVSSAN